MSTTLTNISDCCSECPDPIVENIPGPQGDSAYEVAVENGFVGTEAEWLASLVGDDGENATTFTTALFVQPAVSANVTVAVLDSGWFVVGQKVFVEVGGYYDVVSKPTALSVILTNLGYTGNAAPTTNIPSGSQISPGGIKGTDGASGTGDMLSANNLSDVDDIAASRTNLGLGTMAVETAANYLTKAGNLSGLASAATARTNLGVAIGANVQAWDADLDSIAALASIADRMLYATAAQTWALTTLTPLARTLLDDVLALDMRATLGKVLPRYGVLAAVAAVDLNSALSDNDVVVEASRYRITKVLVENPSAAVTTATLGVFTGAGGTGIAIAADQALSGTLTGTTKYMELVLQAVAGTDTFTATTIRFRVGTAEGAARTANVFMFGERFD